MSTSFDPAAFITAGNAIFTISPSDEAVAFFAARGQDCKPHYTFKVRAKEGEWLGKPTVTWFVSLLTGADNTAWSSYTYMGLLDPKAMTMRLTAKSSYKESSVPVRILRRVLSTAKAGESFPDNYIRHEGKCGRCGRKLTVPSSIDNGIGPECIKYVMGG
jgi:hypothetical protein